MPHNGISGVSESGCCVSPLTGTTECVLKLGGGGGAWTQMCRHSSARGVRGMLSLKRFWVCWKCIRILQMPCLGDYFGIWNGYICMNGPSCPKVPPKMLPSPSPCAVPDIILGIIVLIKWGFFIVTALYQFENKVTLSSLTFCQCQYNPFTPESDQCQNSPAASQEIWHHTVRRTWLFIAYSDERWF